MVQKNCEKCNTTLGDVHGNTKWCGNCREKKRQEQTRKNQQRYRDKKNQGTIIDNPARYQIDNAASPENSAIVPAAPDQELEQFASVFQNTLENLVFNINQQFAGLKYELLDQQKVLELRFEDIEYALKQNPEFKKQIQQWNKQVNEAIQVYKDFGERVPLNRIRQHLEKSLKISKQQAEDVLKEAVKRVQWGRDDDQSSLEDYYT